MTFGQPQLPRGILSPHIELRPGVPEYLADEGGQYLPGSKTRVVFLGAVLPLSERDLKYAPQGTYTKDSKKLYTNGHEVMIGSKIEDANTGAAYTVTSELEYGSIHNLRRYIVETKRRTPV